MAVADFLDHLQVEQRALVHALRFEQSALILQQSLPSAQLVLNGADRLLDPRTRHDEMAFGIDGQLVKNAQFIAGQTMPIAVGESLHSPHEFAHYVQARAIEVLQIDPVTNGGITSSRQALALADAAGLRTSSHYTDELSAHLLCASQHPVYLEKHAFALDPYLEEPQRVVNGHVRPTEVPGTGLRFSEHALAPYRQ